MYEIVSVWKKRVGKCLRPGLIGADAMVANRWDKSPPAPTAQYHCIYEVVEDGSHAGDSVPGWCSQGTRDLCMFEQEMVGVAGALIYICPSGD